MESRSDEEDPALMDGDTVHRTVAPASHAQPRKRPRGPWQLEPQAPQTRLPTAGYLGTAVPSVERQGQHPGILGLRAGCPRRWRSIGEDKKEPMIPRSWRGRCLYPAYTLKCSSDFRPTLCLFHTLWGTEASSSSPLDKGVQTSVLNHSAPELQSSRLASQESTRKPLSLRPRDLDPSSPSENPGSRLQPLTSDTGQFLALVPQTEGSRQLPLPSDRGEEF